MRRFYEYETRYGRFPVPVMSLVVIETLAVAGELAVAVVKGRSFDFA